MSHQESCRVVRLAKIDSLHRAHSLLKDSHYQYLLFNEGHSKSVQALVLDKILSLDRNDNPIRQLVWCFGDVANHVNHNRNCWQHTGQLPLKSNSNLSRKQLCRESILTKSNTWEEHRGQWAPQPKNDGLVS